MTVSNVIEIRRRIADNLATRRAADELFDFVATMPQKIVILNFKSVESVTRSFAHEYILKKKETDKKIVEKNLPSGIKMMFTLVSKQKDGPRTTSIQNFRYSPLGAKNL